MSQVKIFTGFERFWHWSQMALIFGLLFTGFEVHGTYTVLGFEQAYEVHRILAWTLIGLWVLAIFWHLTTGEWRQYVPTTKGLLPMVLYYAYGIFSGEAKPYATTRAAKHNPLQRLAYLGFKLADRPRPVDLRPALDVLHELEGRPAGRPAEPGGDRLGACRGRLRTDDLRHRPRLHGRHHRSPLVCLSQGHGDRLRGPRGAGAARKEGLRRFAIRFLIPFLSFPE